jgi:outer membrane protein TolC
MNSINKLIFLTIVGLLLVTDVSGQDFTPFVQKAWSKNEQLKSKSFQIMQAEAALKEAKSMFGPMVNFGLQYTLAAGGRTIAFPIGDLLNPAYATLNKLTQTNSFPTLENQQINFLPNNFYDARVRLQQPIYYPDLTINRKLQENKIQLQQLEMKAFKRRLSQETMAALIQYNSAQQVVAIYQAADTLLAEAQRSTESMVRNGIALPSSLNRIESERAKNRAASYDAINNVANALAYVKYLMGEPVTEDLAAFRLDQLPDPSTIAPTTKEELLQLDQGIQMSSLAIRKESQFYYPKIGVSVDAGSQDFDFGLQPYVLAGLNLEVNLYDYKRTKHKKEQAIFEQNALLAQKQSVSQQLDLQSEMSKNNLLNAIKVANTFPVRLETNAKIFREVLKKYKEGISGYLELIDAQVQLTNAQQEYTLAKNKAWLLYAEYVYTTASFKIF